jgi:hypothetical protein
MISVSVLNKQCKWTEVRRAGTDETAEVLSEKKMRFGFPASRFPEFAETLW